MKIGIYIGSKQDTTSQYIEKQLIAWGRHLKKFDVDVFGSASLPNSASEYYHHYEPIVQNYRTPYTKVLATYRECMEYVRARDPDVLVQLRNFTTHGAGVALAGRRADLPVLTRYTGDHFNAYKEAKRIIQPHVYSLHNFVGRIPIHFSDHIIALGPFGKSELQRRGKSESEITILPPSPGMEDRFSPPDDKQRYKRDLGLPTNRPVALYVGKFIKRKGMEFLQNVIDSVSPRLDVQFVLVGQGPYSDRFKERYDDDTVHVEGYVDYSQIDRYYKAADMYVHPSPLEGIPLVILEALSCGVPIVARDAGDIEFVTGTVYDSVEGIAQAIVSGGGSAEWHNERYFRPKYQSKTFHRLMTTLFDDSS